MTCTWSGVRHCQQAFVVAGPSVGLQKYHRRSFHKYRFLRRKKMFVATKGSSRAYFCCYKRRVLSWQTHCRDKHVFSPQNFCRNKNDTCGSSRQWYKTARLYKLMYCQQAFAVAGPSSGLQNYISYVIQIIPADVHNQGKDSPEALWSKAIVIRFICTCPIVLLGLSGVRVL